MHKKLGGDTTKGPKLTNCIISCLVMKAGDKEGGKEEKRGGVMALVFPSNHCA